MKSEGPGRPKAIIDWNKVGQMLEAGATAEGCAATLGISVDTLYVRCKKDNKQDFSAFCQEKRAKGDELLRTKQFGVAMSGNVTMLIWLGKQRLGQSDKQEVTTRNPFDEAKKAIKALQAQYPDRTLEDLSVHVAGVFRVDRTRLINEMTH